MELHDKIYDKILELVHDDSYIPLTPHDMEFILGGAEELGEGAFNAAVQVLINENKIVFTKKGKITAIEKSDVILGEFMASTRGFGFVRPAPEYAGRVKKDIFIPFADSMGAVHGDTVACTVIASHDDGKCDGKVIKIISRSIESVTGTVCAIRERGASRERYAVEPDNKRLGFLVYVDNCKQTGALPGYKVVAKITEYPDEKHDALGTVTQVFGDTESTEANYEAILHTRGIKMFYDRAALAEADELSGESVIAGDRLDLRDEIIFTVDSEDAKDLDDAISLKVKPDGSYLLGVHIADVSEYVREGSALDKEAISRGTSVYFADQVVAMLPKSLSNGICSLNGGVDRYALSTFITLSPEGRILDTEIRESIINSTVRGVYSELNDILEKGRASEHYQKYSCLFPDVFPNMIKLYRILAENSRRRGAVELETSESRIIIDENKNPVDIVRRERGESERMIEQFMLCANEAVATWLYYLNMPCVYRIHEEPTEEKLRTLRVFAYNIGLDITSLSAKNIHPKSLQTLMDEANKKGMGDILSTVMLRSMMKARYSENCSPHFGLAIEKYCHFTSPIRRYPDLATHRIIKTVLRGEMDSFRAERLSAFAARAAAASSENERRSMMAERDIEDLYKCVYMSKRIGEIYEGRVSSVTGFGLFVELENSCEGLIPINTLDGYFTFNERSMTLTSNRKVYKLGDRLRVRIDDTDIVTRRIYMTIKATPHNS